MILDSFFKKNKSSIPDKVVIEEAPIVLVKGNDLTLEKLDDNTYSWPESKYSEQDNLEFESAYEIDRNSWFEEIYDCVYKVNDRQFTDLECMKGNSIETFEKKNGNVFEIRKYNDGKRFLFHYHEIPTFDSGDREWDSICHVVVFRDNKGINLIHCQHGYKIPRILIYLNLKKSNPKLDKWFEQLGWERV